MDIGPTLFSLLLLVHGFAHLVGFVIPWRLMDSEEMLAGRVAWLSFLSG